MKFAGYSLAVSFTPISSNIIKNRCRLSVGISRRKLRRSRFFSVYTQSEQSHGKSVMVAKYYLPPWFRWVFELFFFLLPLCLCCKFIDFVTCFDLVFGCLYFSVAPMMDWTDHHYRTLARLISKHAWLYTEMLAAETIVYQNGNLVIF